MTTSTSAGTVFGTSGLPGQQTGIATLTWEGGSFQFRTNPNSMWWTYNLVTSVQQTYGGRVVQILGCNLGDLAVKVDCGNGGWPYLQTIVNTMVAILQAQRNGTPATFEYTGRNYKMNVFAVSIPFEDDWQATIREVTLRFKIQEDVTGVASGAALDAALQKLQDGIYGAGQPVHNAYNDFNQTSTQSTSKESSDGSTTTATAAQAPGTPSQTLPDGTVIPGTPATASSPTPK